MKNYILPILLLLTLFACDEDFLDKQPPIGLTDDKLTDIGSMQALIYGAYGEIRPFVHQPALYGAGMMREVLNRTRGEYDQFYQHQITQVMTGWMYDVAYNALGSLNRVDVTDFESITGTEDQKNAILGDMYFLRALIYFEMNNYFALPSTGYSVPLVLEPLTTSDRVETATTQEIREQVESDIENARRHFENSDGVSNYWAATALAARIYFYHEKYNLSYERADEVINSGNYSLASDVSAPFEPNSDSPENIFVFEFNNVDGPGTSPSSNMWQAYQNNPLNGFYSVNPNGGAAELLLDPDDARYNAFYVESDLYIFVSGKYSTDQMDYRYIRLAEMYLTRAESNVMVSNSVSQQDLDDINALRLRATPNAVLTSTVSIEEMLDHLYVERTKELAFELGDHFLNTKRLRKDIIEIPSEGTGSKSYEEYSDQLVFPFPQIEIDVHGLTRNR